MRKMIIMRGLPGSGKSYKAKEILSKISPGTSVLVASTDDYWLRPDGQYDVNRQLFPQAHTWNQQRVRKFVQKRSGNCVVIVDNTNIELWEPREYVKIALQNQLTIEFAYSDAPWAFNLKGCLRRNSHKVPKKIIEDMIERWVSQDLFTVQGVLCAIPPWLR